MVVAMAIVRMVKVALHQVVDMIAVGHRFVTTTGAMDMPRGMLAAIVLRSAGIGVLAAYGNPMFRGLAACLAWHNFP